MTWSEKIAYRAKQQGRQEGRQEGKRTVLIHLLEKKFGKLPHTMVAQINRISDDELLDGLSEQVLTAVSLSDIQLPDTTT